MKEDMVRKTNELVSIIVPTYNVEKYIDRCIKSLVEQTYINIEIIVVIDGATDSSYIKALEWKKKDSRIQVIYQENAGSGPARNKGLKFSTGKFVVFMDPDDWIEKYMIEDYMKLQQEHDADFITSGYYEEISGKNDNIINPIYFNSYIFHNKNEVRKNYIKLFLMEAVSAPTRILYRKSIIEKNNIEFPDLRRSQDIVFNYKYFNYIEKLIVSNKLYYHYTIESSVYILKLREDYYKTISLLYDDINNMINEWGIDLSLDEIIRFNNKFLVLVSYYIEASVIRNQKCDFIFNDKSIYKIVEKAKPYDKYHKLLKYFFINNNFKMIYSIVKIKIFIKNNFKYVFNKIKKIKKY